MRNGFPPPVDPRFKPSNFPGLLPNPVAAVAAAHNNNNNKDPADLSPSTSISGKKTDFTSLLSSFGSPFPPLIDMSTTQTLLAMVRSAKEAELHGLLKNVKRQQESASPLDLSAAAPPSTKRPRLKMTTTTSSAASSVSPSSTSLPVIVAKRAQSESPRLQEDVSSWTVEDVCGFVGGIDICAEYAQVSLFSNSNLFQTNMNQFKYVYLFIFNGIKIIIIMFYVSKNEMKDFAFSSL